jgi:hypothetical protein
MLVGACPDVLGCISLPEPTPQRHAASIPGIKLSHYVHARNSSVSLVSNGSKNAEKLAKNQVSTALAPINRIYSYFQDEPNQRDGRYITG